MWHKEYMPQATIPLYLSVYQRLKFQVETMVVHGNPKSFFIVKYTNSITKGYLLTPEKG